MIDEDKMRAIETETYLERRNAPVCDVNEDSLESLVIDFSSKGNVVLVAQKLNGERVQEIFPDAISCGFRVVELLESHAGAERI